MGVEAEPAGTWERHAFAACAPLGEYRRREPERALLTEATVARRILDCLGLDSTPPPLARAQASPEAGPARMPRRVDELVLVRLDRP